MSLYDFRPSGFSSAINTIAGNSTIQISDEEKKRILDDENKRLQQLKVSNSLPSDESCHEKTCPSRFTVSWDSNKPAYLQNNDILAKPTVKTI